MTNNFDYRQEYLQVDEIIPPIFKTDPNIAIMNSSINRLLTKEDTINVVGKVGKPIKDDTSIPPNLPENEVHRQAYQLQPLVYSQFATDETITSFKDILNKLKLMGVDLDQQGIWGESERFTFAPPIHLDKFVNYRDYYWTGDTTPDYVTMHNKLESLQSKIYELELDNTLSNQKQLLDIANRQYKIATDEYNSIVNPSSWVDKKYVPKYHWISSNKWVHKTDIHNESRKIIFAKPAKHPIIEFFDDIEVNEWTKTTYQWLYRANPNNPWSLSNSNPTDNELSIRYQITDIFENSFQVDGNVTDVFHDKMEFMVVSSTSNGKYIVDKTLVHDGVTEIYVRDHLKPKNLYTISMTSDNEFLGFAGDTYGVIIPQVQTSLGDPWLGVYQHWMVVSSNVLPIDKQHFVSNGYAFTHVVKEYGFGEDFDSDSYDGETTFTFDFSYMLDTDDLRVYINGVRQYGTYDEINTGAAAEPTSHFDTAKFDKDQFDLVIPKSDQVNNSIAFNIDLMEGDVIRIEAGPHVESDMNKHGVYVRVYHKDYLDTKPLVHYKNLIEYRIKEQVKHKSNQHINFDIFNVDGSSANTTNHIFRYLEDFQMNISADLEIRTPIINNNYAFANQLVDGETLLCYKNPLLNTVWQKTNNYAPIKVDQYREAPVNPVATDWEIHEPFIKNIHHECKNELMYIELQSHFQDILSKQVDDLPFKHSIGKSLDSYVYNGGTICEHNGRYDLFVSLMHQDHTNFISAVNFAKLKYAENLDGVYKAAIKNIAKYLIVKHDGVTKISELYDKVITQVIDVYTSNISLDHIFNDTTAYEDGVGVRNWVASLPILGLKRPVQPIILKDDVLSIYKLRHHDGHLSDFKLTDTYNQLLMDQYGEALVGYDALYGSAMPFNGALRMVDYQLQLCILDYRQGGTPLGANDGEFWYNTETSELSAYSSEWHHVDAGNCWHDISNTRLIEGIFLSIETNLYDRAMQINNRINIPELLGDKSSQFFGKLTDRFLTYTKNVADLAQPIIYDPTDAFTWNYIDLKTDISVTIHYQNDNPKWAAFWHEIYELQYGTAYPHLEPWILHGYTGKPIWWDRYYAKVGDIQMWINIRNGVIPTSKDIVDAIGREALEKVSVNFAKEIVDTWSKPSIIKFYSVISVNDTGREVDGYAPNALLPPYINSTRLPHHSLVSGMDIMPNTDIPSMGMQDAPERQWRESIDYNYDVLITLFLLQPVKTFNRLFDSNNISVGGLQIDKDLKKVPSSKDVTFHGSAIDGKKYISNGMNQWFINQLRSDNNVSSIAAFHNAWTQWQLKLTYQTDSIINEHSLLVDSPIFYVTKDDFNLKLKKSPGAKELVMHALLFSLNKMGKYSAHISTGNLIPMTDGSDWEFRLDIPVVSNNTLPYYDVCRYTIENVNIVHGYFTLNRSTPLITDEDMVMYYDSPSMQTTMQYKLIRYSGDMYEISTYDISQNNTSLLGPKDYDLWYDKINHIIMQYSAVAGSWVSYSNTSYQFMVPSDNSNMVIYNNGDILTTADYTFSNRTITINKNIVICNLSVTMTIDRYGLAAYDLPTNSFIPLPLYDELVGYLQDIPAMPNDYDLWYDVSKDRIMQYRWPSDTWVSYSTTEYQFMVPTDSTNMVIYNDGIILDGVDYTINNRKVTISKNVAIGKLSVKIAIPLGTIIECVESPFYALSSMNCPLMWNHVKVDTLAPLKYITTPAIIKGVQSVIDFIDGYSYWLMQQGFMFNDYENPRQDDVYPDRVMGWQLEIEKFIDKTWSGFNTKFDIPVSNTSLPYQYSTLYDYIAVNPFKYEFWINTPQGIISNILKGPYKDMVFTPLIYNASGKLITDVDNIKIYRTDKQAHVEYPYIDGDDYIGGVHLFVDYYEHVVQFNDYTINGNLVYDSFLGINNDNIIVSMNKHYESTRRPNIGGGFLMGQSVIDNIESNTQNFQDLYDTSSNGDIKKYTKNARRTIGYDGFKYITQLDTQSKFLLWKGMINNKGTNHIIDTYTQLSGVDRITIDEIWLYKLGDYGVLNAPREQWNHILDADINRNDIRYNFGSELVDAFVQIKPTDNSRWNRFTTTPVLNYTKTNTIRYSINGAANAPKLSGLYETINVNLPDTLTSISVDQLSNKMELSIALNYDLSATIDSASILNGSFVVPSYLVGSGMLTAVAAGKVLSIVEVGTGISTSIKVHNVTGKFTLYYNKGILKEGIHYTQSVQNTFNLIGSYISNIDSLDIGLFNYDHITQRTNMLSTDMILMGYKQVNTLRYIMNEQAKITSIDGLYANKIVDLSVDKLKFIKIDQISNRCDLYVELNYDSFVVVDGPDAVNGIITIPSYVVGCDMLTAIAGGNTISITEVGTGVSTGIQIDSSITGKIALYYKRALLKEGVHYYQLRQNLFEIIGDFLGSVDCFDICLFNYDHESTTANIIDTVNDVITRPLPYFDPRLGIYPKEIKNVDYVIGVDPANYADAFWNVSEIGKKWIDTKDLGYYCYSDSVVYPKTSDQIALWGATASWSHIDCYEWVESDIPPSDWSSYVSRSTGNTTNATRYIGKPLTVLNIRKRDSVDSAWGDFVVEQNTYQTIDAFNYDIVNGTITFKVLLRIDPYKDNYSLYVNEIIYGDYDVFMTTNVLSTIEVRNISKTDTIRLVRFADTPTSEQVNLTAADQLVDYQYSYKYNMVKEYDDLGIYSTKKYYFWVTGQISRAHNNISTTDIEEIFLSNKNPYVFNIDVDKWVINNIMNNINAFAAFQLIQNNSLYSYDDYQSNTHNAYTEWLSIRENSLSKVPQVLWDKLVDTLTNSNVSNDLKIFDSVNNTNYRYGIKPGQIMGDPTNALRSLLDLFYQNDFDITPENKDYFLDDHLFDTNDNIIKSMSYIYDRLSAPVINRIFFHILKDSLSYNNKMDDILKTSIIAVECESKVPTWS